MAYSAYDIVAPCPLPISRQQISNEWCSAHSASLKAYAEKFEAETSKWPEFPMLYAN